MRALFTIPLLLSVLPASAGNLILLEERIDGDEFSSEYAIEGLDSLRVHVRTIWSVTSWQIYRQHSSGGWDMLFNIYPIMVDEEGTYWWGHVRSVQDLLFEEKDGEVFLKASYDHDQQEFFGEDCSTTWWYYRRPPVILFTGAPGADSNMAQPEYDYRWMSLDEIGEEGSPWFHYVLTIPFGEFSLNLDRMLSAPVLDRDSIAELDTLTFQTGSDLSGGMQGISSSRNLTIVRWAPVEVTLFERETIGFFFAKYGSCEYSPCDSMPTATTGWIELKEMDGKFEQIIPDGESHHSPELSPEAWEAAEAYAASYTARWGIEMGIEEGLLNRDYLIRITAADGTTREKMLIFLRRPGG
jgi:hypothetical protein